MPCIWVVKSGPTALEELVVDEGSNGKWQVATRNWEVSAEMKMPRNALPGRATPQRPTVGRPTQHRAVHPLKAASVRASLIHAPGAKVSILTRQTGHPNLSRSASYKLTICQSWITKTDDFFALLENRIVGDDTTFPLRSFNAPRHHQHVHGTSTMPASVSYNPGSFDPCMSYPTLP